MSTDSRPVLVTGASGLLGEAVAARLAARGDAVIAIDVAEAPDARVPVTPCDVRDVHRLRQITASGVSAVVHCGAYSGPMVARDRPDSMVKVNVVGTANVLEIARIHDARRFVFASSTTVYGETGPGPVTEETPPRVASLYAASKVASEQLVVAYAEQYGVSGVSLRLSWVYGPRRTTDCVIRDMILDAHARRPTRLTYGYDFARQFIHVDDASRALVLGLDARRIDRPVLNVTGGTRVTLANIAQMVRDAVPGADIELMNGPDPVDQNQERVDIRAAGREIGYEPAITLDEGIRAYAGWLAAR